MKGPLKRLATFCHFPQGRECFVCRLASDGFIYLPSFDSIQCECCDAVFCQWERGVPGAHKAHEASCPMVVEENGGNGMGVHTGQQQDSLHDDEVKGRGDQHLAAEGLQSHGDTNAKPHEDGLEQPTEFPEATFGARQDRLKHPEELESFPQPAETGNKKKTEEERKRLILLAAVVVFLSTWRSHTKQKYKDASEIDWLFTSFHFPSGSGGLVYPVTPQIPRHPEMCYESTRLASFASQSLPEGLANSPIKLAGAGFFFDGSYDQVKCFYCGTFLRDTDDAARPERHAPLGQVCDQANCSIPFNQCVTGPLQQQADPASLGLNIRQTGGLQGAGDTDPVILWREQMGVNLRPPSRRLSGPRNPGYESFNTRLDSFRQRSPIAGNFHDLARAGFFAMAQGQVSCFYCGVVLALEDLVADGTPDLCHILSLHAGRVPRCGFARTELQTERRRRSLQAQGPSQQPPANAAAVPTATVTTPTNRGSCHLCTNQADVVFLPCGHIAACQDCAQGLRRCPVCGGYIRGTVSIFRS